MLSARLSLLAICLGLGLFLPTPVWAQDMIRVALERQITEVELHAEGMSCYPSGQKKLSKQVETLHLKLLPGGLESTPELFPALEKITCTSRSQRLCVSGAQCYRGVIQVRRETNRNSLIVINRLNLEQYLLGVIGSEMPWDWPLEALKAQAVAARTYAVNRRLEGTQEDFDVDATVEDQVYQGRRHEKPSIETAVNATSGEILSDGNLPILAYFHSCCGGETHSSASMFGKPKNYLPGGNDPFCSKAPNFRWSRRLTLSAIAEKLRKAYPDLRRIRSLEVSASDRPAVRVTTGDNTLDIPTVDFRRLVGYDVLKSPQFEISLEGDEVKFEGHGSGHGVGLCQWGARGMAQENHEYLEILQHYYPGAQLRHIY